MEHLNVLIADDEQIVREGLHYIIDWEDLGFSVCAAVDNGQSALEKIRQYQPDLVLLDIRMPKLSGIELIEKVRSEGFIGEFIILSGYSDFKYAQTAIRYGVSYYLTKPIDEDELEKAAVDIREKVLAKRKTSLSMKQYLTKAKQPILLDLLAGKERNASINYEELGLSYPLYQVVIYEGYTPFYHTYNFAELLRVTNQGNNSFEDIQVDNYNVILLKGTRALSRFHTCLMHYEDGPEKGSPLDSIFLTYGPVVNNLDDIHVSYDICKKLMSRRFFCDENQHVLSYEMLPEEASEEFVLDPFVAKEYSRRLIDYIQSYNRREISETLAQLKHRLYDCNADIDKIKYFLADIFLQVKHTISHVYSNVEIPFAPNAAILELIENKYYLYEILLYFTEQSDLIIRAIGNTSSDSIFDDILYYIKHNYEEPLKLESIAPLFGYNSSYLGKLFSQKMGQNFNSYLDSVRIREATHLLDTTSMKVYEIAARVGYRNVDYFHQKFKKQMNLSPAEYRKRLNS